MGEHSSEYVQSKFKKKLELMSCRSRYVSRYNNKKLCKSDGYHGFISDSFIFNQVI